MISTPRMGTLGSIDRVTLTGNLLTIEGWAASENAGGVVGFNTFVCGQLCRVRQYDLGISSPDVELAHPKLAKSGNCRFVLRLDVPRHLPGRDKPFVTMEPWFEKGLGTKLWYLAPSSLPVPPADFITVIGSGYRDVAQEFLEYFVGMAGLKPGDAVLDIGCGVGRMTYGLVNYLNTTARYEGFDIIAELIEWAQKEITPQYPNFRFQHAPIFNSHYNKTGHLKPAEYVFPFDDASFDFFFLTSVFTHMPGDVVRHYMQEIRRTLKPGGRGLITCFLLNRDSMPLIDSGQTPMALRYPQGDGMVLDPANPDYAIGFDEGMFRAWLKDAGLHVADTAYGSWCGREEHVSYQDLVVVQG